MHPMSFQKQEPRWLPRQCAGVLQGRVPLVGLLRVERLRQHLRAGVSRNIGFKRYSVQ